MTEPLWGKYVGVVKVNLDPASQGRLMVDVPEVGSEQWAKASLSAYEASHLDEFVPPPVGAAVWVEFEGGDVRFPIWTGCCWPV